MSFRLDTLPNAPTPLHDQPTTIRRHEPNAEIHIDSSRFAPPEDVIISQFQYSRNNPLGLHNTGLSEAGASSGHWGSPARTRPGTPQPMGRPYLEGFTVEGGWQQDDFGQYHRVDVGHGRIEEVVSGASGHIDDVYVDMTTASSPVPYDNQALYYSAPMRMTEPLPRGTTPPPRPMPRTINMLRSTSTAPPSAGGIYGNSPLALSSLNFGSSPIDGPAASTTANAQAFRAGVTSRALSTLNLASSPLSRPPEHGQPEPDLLEASLRSIKTALTCVDSLSLVFTIANNLFDVRANVASCDHIKASLLAVKTSLSRRSRFNEDQWRMGSQNSHIKYNERLSSLERTLQKFCSFENYVRNHRTSLKLVYRSVEKLQEYESKFSNLDLKFNALFNRIRVRQLHSKLSEAHAEAQRVRNTEHAKRDSFKSQWAEGKALRAALRRDYHAYRNGRRPSLVT